MWLDGTFCLAAKANDLETESAQKLVGVCIGMLVFGLLMLIPGVLLFVLPMYRRLRWIRARAVALDRLPPMDDPAVQARWAWLARAVAAEAESNDDGPASLLVHFQDRAGGEQFALISRQPESKWASPGAQVTILYNPARPWRAKVDEFLPATSAMLCFFGGMLVLAAAMTRWVSTGMGK
jgi:hypothetical protein